MKPEEIRKLTAYFKRVFQNPNIDVKARPRKEDSAEVYVGDEFIGLVYKDEEDGDYNFQMAILDIVTESPPRSRAQPPVSSMEAALARIAASSSRQFPSRCCGKR